MDLRSNQIKDTYGNLLTVGTTAGSPTTGTVENGQGSDITDLTVNGTLNATTLNGALNGSVSGNVTGNITGTVLNGSDIENGVTTPTLAYSDESTKIPNTSWVKNRINASTSDIGTLNLGDNDGDAGSVDLTSEALQIGGTSGQIDVSLSSNVYTLGLSYNQQNPNIRVSMFNPVSLTNSTNNYVGFSGFFKGPAVNGLQPSTTFDLVNSGQATSTGARVHVKEPGQYLFNVYAKISNLGNGTEVFINITESTTSSGAMSSAKGIVQHTYSHNAMTVIATGTVFLYNNNTNNYYSFYINPSSNTPTLEFAELQIIRLSPV